MGFLQGSVSFLRFRVGGPAPRLFDQEHLDRLADHAAGRQRVAAADGVEVGWTAGGHVLDTAFDLEMNVVNDSLHFELAVESDKLPADKLKAYTAIELKALAAMNPSGLASAKQKRKAKEMARARLEEEAKDGRFRKRKCFPVMWDRTTSEVMFGATSTSQVDRLRSLFERTFGAKLEARTAGIAAAELTATRRAMSGEDPDAMSVATPSRFLTDVSYTSDFAWVPDALGCDWLGNEFLLWLWYWSDVVSDTLSLPDASEATFMLARSLVVDCPRGQTGTDGFRYEGPTRLPEARRAIQSGKLPRKCGLTVVRHDRQYEFTLHAETLAVGAGKLPPPPDDATDARARLDARVGGVREFVATLDLLYSAFLIRRLGREWPADLAAMQAWLARRDAASNAA